MTSARGGQASHPGTRKVAELEADGRALLVRTPRAFWL